MIMPIFTLIVLLHFVGIQSHLLPYQPSCEGDILVDRNNASCEFSSIVSQQVRCSSLKDAFDLIDNEEYSKLNCTRIFLNHSDLLESSINVHSSVYLQSTGLKAVEVHFASPNEIIYLSFREADFVLIDGIDFVSFNGAYISFEKITMVQILHSSFRYFQLGAVDIYNCPQVLVMKCSFQSNGPVNIRKEGLWRGHAGGLSIALYSVDNAFNNIVITLTHNNFFNNTSDPRFSNTRVTTNVLTNFIFLGRGGGCAINLNTPTASEVFVANSTFHSNYARAYGGGLYLAFGVVANHSVHVQESFFIENETPGGAGGLEVGFALGGPNNLANTVVGINLVFLRNSASYGGGSFVFIAGKRQNTSESGNLVKFINCTFEENSASLYGGALGMVMIASSLVFGNREQFIAIDIHFCVFLRNSGGHGASVTTYYVPTNFKGTNNFTGSRGTALMIIGARLYVDGIMTFEQNSAIGEGGALYSISLGQISMLHNARMIFINNTATLGAAIAVKNLKVPSLFSMLANNPLCVFLWEDDLLPDNDENSMVAFFSSNIALVGSGVYTNNIDTCSWTGEPSGTNYFNRNQTFKWSFFNYSNNNENRAHFPDNLNPKWYVQTQEVLLKAEYEEYTAYPGQQILIKLIALDELKLETTSFIRISDGISFFHQNHPRVIRIYPSTFTLDEFNRATLRLSFNINFPTYQQFNETIVFEPTRGQNVQAILKVVECPAGYTLLEIPNKNEYTCYCNLKNKHIMSCNGSALQLKEGYWSSTSTLSIFPCSFRYCKCSLENVAEDRFTYRSVLNTSNGSNQCLCNRQGVLCGQCKHGNGFSAIFNKCTTCSKISGLWIFGLIAADLLVYVWILLFCIKLPTYITPFVVYIQILPILAEFFPCSFEKFHNLLGSIASATSYGFAYDFCLGPVINSTTIYFIKYLPIVVAVSVFSIVMAILRFSTHNNSKSKLSHQKAFYGFVWWIMNFLYIHTVNTSMEVLRCYNVHIENQTYSQRWSINGEIECYKGSHLALAVVAVFMLLLSVMIIPTIVLLTLPKFDRKGYFSEVLSSGYKSTYKWWLAMDFAKRFILLLLNSAFTRNNYPVMLLLSGIITFHGILMPISITISNISEVILPAIVLLLLLIRNTQHEGLISIPKPEIDKSKDSCVIKEGHATPFSYILMALYYLPLLLAILALSYWITKLVVYYYKKSFQSSRSANILRLEDRSMSYRRYEDMEQPNVHTTTDISQYL